MEEKETRERRMLVTNSFDLWQKDIFFPAAEEVQQSAEIMESAYRAWLRARKEGLISQNLYKINRELQMTLGTAKWQLEEFERAVCLSYRNNGDDITINLHKEFISAIEDQISRVETALKNSLQVEEKKPFRWVNLDKEECNDLAHFLSGTPGTSQIIKDGCFGDKESSPVNRHEISYRADQISSNQTASSSVDMNTLEIVIDVDDRQMSGLTEATPEKSSSKPFIWRSRGEVCHRAKEVHNHTQMKLRNWINHLFRGRQRSQRLVSPLPPVKSIRYVLALMLTIFFNLYHSCSTRLEPC